MPTSISQVFLPLKDGRPGCRSTSALRKVRTAQSSAPANGWVSPKAETESATENNCPPETEGEGENVG